MTAEQIIASLKQLANAQAIEGIDEDFQTSPII
jgi:hypothetical protein